MRRQTRRQRAPAIINNHRAKVFATGIGDPDTLTYIRQVTGDGEFRQRNETAGEKGRTLATEGSTYRDLAPAMSFVRRNAEALCSSTGTCQPRGCRCGRDLRSPT